jgi:hypothetical protein
MIALTSWITSLRFSDIISWASICHKRVVEVLQLGYNPFVMISPNLQELEPFEQISREEISAKVRQRLDDLKLSARSRHILLMRVIAETPASLERMAVTYNCSVEELALRERALIALLRVVLGDLVDNARYS